MKVFYWVIPVAFLFVTACVPNKKIVFLQNDDINDRAIPKDTLLRTYNLAIREYKIQPLDILSIRIESLTEDEFDFIAKLYPNAQQQQGGGNNAGSQLLNGFLVDNAGEIEFPVVGKLGFAGLSVFEAQEMLRDKFSPYLKDPVARVNLLNFRFTILGEVNAEQQVISRNTRVTIMEAIGMAGGLTDLADRNNVKIVRQNGSVSKVLYLNLLDENLLTAENYYVQQNDIIVVPPLRQRPFRKYWGQNIALFVSTVSVILFTVNLLK
ncbi:MAG: polysaccharide biosynthesis/export family protein [Cyclobacteriaceae bacterium]